MAKTRKLFVVLGVVVGWLCALAQPFVPTDVWQLKIVMIAAARVLPQPLLR
jgi:hypothetical protein